MSLFQVIGRKKDWCTGDKVLLVSLITLFAGFFTTYFITPTFISFLKNIGVLSTDVHKSKKPLIPISGGLCVVTGLLAGLFVYIGINTFVYNRTAELTDLFAALTSILIITFTGFLDDLNCKLEEHEGFKYKKGLKQWQKPLLTLPAAIPLMAISAGTTTMSIPFLGPVNFGILYPLFIVPAAIVGAANMVNLLGGFNGIEAGMGIIYTFSLGMYSLYINESISAILFLTSSVCLAAFFMFNMVPAKILSGDSLTYLLGGVVAVGTIIGNIEKFALFTMVLFIFEGILKFKSYFEMGKFATSLGELGKKGLLKPKYDKVYSLTHLAMSEDGSTEKEVVIKLVLAQVVVSIIPWILFVF